MPAEYHKPKAAFLCEGRSIFDVYDPETLALLEEKLSLSRTVFRKADLEKQPLLLADAEYIFSTWGMPAFTEAEIEKFFPRLRALFYGAGSVRGFAREFLRKGIRVFSAWGANAVPVAEFAVSQIVLAGKGFFQGLRIMEREGRAACMQYIGGFPGNYRTKVGILGAGMIGSRVCEMLKAYDFEVLVYDPFAGDDKLEALHAQRAELDRIFTECQTISNHIANVPETVGLLNYACFSKMKKNATFLNTGRGAQVVEADLIRALTEEPARTAVLDVTWPEPPLPESPLWSLPNVFLTPHIAGRMHRETARMGAFMEREFSLFLTGKPCRYEVTEEMLKTMA